MPKQLAAQMKIGKSGETAGDLREQGRCPFCSLHVKLGDFDGPLSVKEFRISGLCQSCQDDIFTEGG